MGSGADLLALVVAIEHRAAGNADRRQITARGPHQQRWCGLVTPDQQHDPVHRKPADRLLDIHRGEVPIQHRGWPHLAFGVREDRELEWKAASLPDASLHMFADLAEVGVAGIELAKSIRDADHRTTVEHLARKPLVLHPRAVRVAVLVDLAPPLGRAAFSFVRVVPGGHGRSSDGCSSSGCLGLFVLMCGGSRAVWAGSSVSRPCTTTRRFDGTSRDENTQVGEIKAEHQSALAPGNPRRCLASRDGRC